MGASVSVSERPSHHEVKTLLDRKKWGSKVDELFSRQETMHKNQLFCAWDEAIQAEIPPRLVEHDFSPLIKEKQLSFAKGTRQWLFDAIESWLYDPDASKIFVLYGQAGIGKSVISAKLLPPVGAVNHHGSRVAAWHFCRHNDTEKSSPIAVLASLSAMLCRNVAGFIDNLDRSAIDPVFATGHADKAFETLVAEPLTKCEQPSNSPIIILFDALDELPRDNGRGEMLRLIRDAGSSFPSWLRIFVTSREEDDVKKQLARFKPVELRVDEERNRADVTAYLTSIARKYIRAQVSTQDLERDVRREFGFTIDGELSSLREPILKQQEIYDAAVAPCQQCDHCFQDVCAVLPMYKEDLRQPIHDFNLLYKDAQEAQELLAKFAQDDWIHLQGEAIIPSVKSRQRAREKTKSEYSGDASKLKDLSRISLVFENCSLLTQALYELNRMSMHQDALFRIALLKNKFASPTPMGYRDISLILDLKLKDRRHLCEVQLHLACLMCAKAQGHQYYELVRKVLPEICARKAKGDARTADKLEGFLVNRLCNSASGPALSAMIDSAEGLMMYARLLEKNLEHKVKTQNGKLSYNDVCELPAGLDGMYFENFCRAFPEKDKDTAWIRSRRLIAIIVSAKEPLPVELARSVLGSNEIDELSREIALLFPQRDSRFHVLHKSVVDWLRSSSRSNDFRLSEDDIIAADSLLTEKLTEILDQPLNDGTLLKRLLAGSTTCLQYALRHVVAHAARAQEWHGMETVLSLRFLEATATIGHCAELVHDLSLLHVSANPARVLEFRRFVQQNSHIFSQRPKDIYTLAAKWPDKSFPRHALNKLLQSNAPEVSYILEQFANKPKTLNPCLLTLEGAKGAVYGCSFSKDSKRVAVCSRDKTCRLYDIEIGVEILKLENGTKDVTHCQISENDMFIATSSKDKTTRLWSLETGLELHCLEHSREVTCVSFSHDSKRLVTSSDTSVKIWECGSGSLQATIGHHTATVSSCIFSKNDMWIVSAGADNVARIALASKDHRLLKCFEGHERTVNCCAISFDQKLVVTASDDFLAKVWAVETCTEVWKLQGHSCEVVSCDISSTNLIITASKDLSARIWLAETGELRNVLLAHVSPLTCCVFSSDGMLCLTSSSDKTTKVYDLEILPPASAEEKATQREASEVSSCAFSCDGSRIATGSRRCAQYFDAYSGDLLKTINDVKDVTSVAFSPDGYRFCTTSKDWTIKIFDATTGKLRQRMEGHKDAINCCAFSKKGNMIVTASHDKTVRCWDVVTGALRATLKSHGSWVLCCAINDSGSEIITGTYEVAKIFETKSGNLMQTLRGHTGDINDCAYFSKDDQSLILTAGDDKTCRLWDAKSGLEQQRFKGHTSYVYSCAFTCCGLRVVTASRDMTARIWEIKSGAELAIYYSETSISSVATSPVDPECFAITTGNEFRLLAPATSSLKKSASSQLEVNEESSLI